MCYYKKVLLVAKCVLVCTGLNGVQKDATIGSIAWSCSWSQATIFFPFTFISSIGLHDFQWDWIPASSFRQITLSLYTPPTKSIQSTPITKQWKKIPKHIYILFQLSHCVDCICLGGHNRKFPVENHFLFCFSCAKTSASDCTKNPRVFYGFLITLLWHLNM